MIQNHTMQLLALTAMEPPGLAGRRGGARRKGKSPEGHPAPRARRAATSPAPSTRRHDGGQDGPGLSQEKGVNPESATETFAAIRLSINNWRWQGVPSICVPANGWPAGSRKSPSSSRRPPGDPFRRRRAFDLAANTLSFQIQPDEGLSLILNGKIPGLETRTQPVKMSFKYSTTFGSNTPEAYERLVLDAMVGDGTLFIRGDET